MEPDVDTVINKPPRYGIRINLIREAGKEMEFALIKVDSFYEDDDTELEGVFFPISYLDEVINSLREVRVLVNERMNEGLSVQRDGGE